MKPRTRNIVVVIIVAAVVVAGVGAYLVLRGSSTANCGPHQRSYICIDQAEIPDSLDPAVTFSTPGWAAVQQVYQGLVNYNGSSFTTFSPVLASSWVVTNNPHTNFSTYTFQLRSGVTFSNGDPYNAYVQWYSFYRSLLLAQGPQFIQEQNFFSTNFSTTTPLSYYSGVSYSQAANATLVSDLNSWNFASPTAGEIALMGLPLQSFQVLGPTSIALNLGYGYLASNYTYLLASISAPNSYAVDPAWVDQHGGVLNNTVNDFLASDTLGTGPYLLSNYNPVGGGGYTLKPSGSYWGAAASKTEPWNNNLQPANTSIEVIFQAAIDITTADLKSGHVQGASFAYTGPSTIAQLQALSNVVTQPLSTIYSATSGSWWVFLNSSVAPFNNLSVREAIAHAINYAQIIQVAFGGYGTQWVGPVPPDYPYNNNVTANEPYYQYNLPLAYQEMANSPCKNGACSGMTMNYMYLNNGADWAETAQLLANDLKAINITINPVGVTLPQLYAEQGVNTAHACISATTANGGPFYIGQEFYTSDYISPDDWTQNNALGAGSANKCMSGFSNGTVNSDVYAAASSSNSATLTALYTEMTTLLYNNYSEIWLVVPTSFAVYATNLQGVVENPMGAAQPYTIAQNTQWLS